MVTLILTEDELKAIIDWGRVTAETYPDDWEELDETALQKCEDVLPLEGERDDREGRSGSEEGDEQEQMEFDFDE